MKYRSNKESGYASAAVDYRKQKRISQAAQFFLLRYGYGEPPCRFDVVAIDGEQIQWIKNAFDYGLFAYNTVNFWCVSCKHRADKINFIVKENSAGLFFLFLIDR